MDETLKMALVVADAFDQLGVRWFFGGSLASSINGVPRATFDADLVADLSADHVGPLVGLLGEGWYADEGAIGEAIAHRSSFNLIHFDTGMKVDVFLPKPRRFDEEQFGRVRRSPVAEGSGTEVPVCSGEDIVIVKLEWFKMGGEVSERQWKDVLGVLRVNRKTLDHEVMQAAADELDVGDLLERALAESEAESG